VARQELSSSQGRRAAQENGSSLTLGGNFDDLSSARVNRSDGRDVATMAAVAMEQSRTEQKMHPKESWIFGLKKRHFLTG
jgi:hypothetical protein